MQPIAATEPPPFHPRVTADWPTVGTPTPGDAGDADKLGRHKIRLHLDIFLKKSERSIENDPSNLLKPFKGPCYKVHSMRNPKKSERTTQ